eukprot:841272-Heterocapsa_arctica.AAC.1
MNKNPPVGPSRNAGISNSDKFMGVGGLFGAYWTSVLFRLKLGLSSSESMQNDQRVARNLMATTRTSGFENANVSFKNSR